MISLHDELLRVGGSAFERLFCTALQQVLLKLLCFATPTLAKIGVSIDKLGGGTVSMMSLKLLLYSECAIQTLSPSEEYISFHIIKAPDDTTRIRSTIATEESTICIKARTIHNSQLLEITLQLK